MTNQNVKVINQGYYTQQEKLHYTCKKPSGMCSIHIFVHSLKPFACMKLFAEILALLGHFLDSHRLAAFIWH